MTRDSHSHYVTATIATPKLNQTKRKLKRMDSSLMNDSNRNHNQLNKATSAAAAAAAVALNRKIVFEIYTQSQEGALRSTTNSSNQMPLTVMKILPPNHRQNEFHAINNNNHEAPPAQLLRHSSVPIRKELKLTIIPIPTIVTATAAALSPSTANTAISTPSPPSITMKPIAFIRNLFDSLRPSKSRSGFYSPTRDLSPIGEIALQLSTNVDVDDGDGTDVANDVRRKEQLSGDEGDGSISNSSMKHVGQNALEDELSAYMQEIREREKR